MNKQSCLLSLVNGKPSLTVFKDIVNYEKDDISGKIVDLLETFKIPKMWRSRLENTSYGITCILYFNLNLSSYLNSLNLEDGFLTLDLKPTLEQMKEGEQFKLALSCK